MKRISSALFVLLQVNLLHFGAVTNTHADECTSVIKDLTQMGYGNYIVRGPETINLEFANQILEISRMKRYSFQNQAQIYGIVGKLTLLCRDGNSIGIIIHLTRAMSKDQFRNTVIKVAEPLACFDRCSIAMDATKYMPTLNTCWVHRKDNTFIFLSEDGLIVSFIDVPELLALFGSH